MTTVKGLLVEIGGDTSGLQKALSKVNSASSSLSRELRGINSLLKLDPKNTELLAQKQTVLANNIKETEDKIEEMTKNISEDTILIISADHGHKDIQKAYTLLDYPEIQECLIMPASLECRFLSFFVKEEMKDVIKNQSLWFRLKL